MMELQHLENQIKALEALVKSQAKEIKEMKESMMVVNPKLNEQKEEFENLKTLLESGQWPAAVEPNLICDINNEQDKEDRAEGIIDIIIDVHLENQAFLDFGCGEGHVINKSLQYKPKVSVGYDLKENPVWDKWKNNGNALLTTNWEEVVKNGPYNVVLLYDVLDHAEDMSQIEILKKIKTVCTPDTKIYVRCHPFCSRHGTHLYQKLNKAYVHLVLTEDELKKLGHQPEDHMKTTRIIHPQAQYNEWFNLAGLRMVKHNFYREPVEPFFRDTPLVARRIKRHWQHSPDEGLRSGRIFPAPQMEQQFNDYVLKI